MVYASHVLEHLPMADAEKALNEWIRILKPGGKLRLKVPNIRWSALHISRPGSPHPYVFQTLYGGQANDGEFHMNGFIKETLEALASLCPLLGSFTVRENHVDQSGMGSELILEGVRKGADPKISTKDVFDELAAAGKISGTKQKEKPENGESTVDSVPLADGTVSASLGE
jgi:hypothetical protein